MSARIRFADVVKSFNVPGIVALTYDQDGVQVMSKVKAEACGLHCPQCGCVCTLLTASRRGLVCDKCRRRQSKTGNSGESDHE